MPEPEGVQVHVHVQESTCDGVVLLDEEEAEGIDIQAPARVRVDTVR
jgi:hypothetical protein